jgi:hypothetical protein
VPGPIHEYLASDHERLDALLQRALPCSTELDRVPFEEFRAGLLRHIAMEEKVLLREARRLRKGVPLEAAAQLRNDHAALAALMVPTPTREIALAVREILEAHNRIEEGADGVYAECERLAGPAVAELLARIRALPAVPVAAHADGPRIQRHVEHLLELRAKHRG